MTILDTRPAPNTPAPPTGTHIAGRLQARLDAIDTPTHVLTARALAHIDNATARSRDFALGYGNAVLALHHTQHAAARAWTRRHGTP